MSKANYGTYIVSSILPQKTNEKHSGYFPEQTINCFRDLLTFKWSRNFQYSKFETEFYVAILSHMYNFVYKIFENDDQKIQLLTSQICNSTLNRRNEPTAFNSNLTSICSKIFLKFTASLLTKFNCIIWRELILIWRM